jgi:RNA polymerase sigma factor (sigma-70 family)
MTAVSNWDTVEPRTTDAELVRSSVAGDRAAFAQIYDRYADRLHDFCVGMLRDLDGAADCVQDTFVAAATRLHQLKDPDKLRPWLYSIARNEALRRIRDRRRETPTDEMPEVASDDDSLDTLTARTELADLISDVAGGLSDRDRAILDLTYRHGLDGPDLADALEVSHNNANAMVMRLRLTIERSLGALLILRRAQKNPEACADLREILTNWDGQFTVLMRKRVARHIESCFTCDEERRRLVSPSALLGAAPVFVPAPVWLREKTLGDIQLVSHESAMETAPEAHPPDAGPPSSGRGRRRRMLLAALLIAQLGASAALMFACNPSPGSVVPAEMTETAPEPTAKKPIDVKPPPPKVVPPPVRPTRPPVPVMAPTAVAPPSIDPPADPETEEPPSEPSPDPVSPSTRVPMSFTPTVVATPPAGSDPGGGGSGSSRVGAP